jgi:hypothetical protein
VQLRAHGQIAGAAESKPPGPPTGFVTSFGPLTAATRSPTARDRQWDARDGARTSQRQARDGHTFVVLHVDRDFHTGAGLVSFLFGSGIVIKPEWNQLVVASGKTRYPLAATFAEGHTVELAYEVPAAAHGLVLRDGDDELPLDPLLAARPAAAN